MSLMISWKSATVGVLLPLALVLTACGEGADDKDERPEPSATEHNEADVAFAQQMIPHHAQALAMVDLTLERPLDPEVEQLVEGVRSAQAPEIETMTDWLQDWDEEVPETVRDHSNAGHDMDHMEGMMDDEDMAELADATDADFQELWLTMMIEHHEGAVEMAEGQLDEGRNQAVLDLAQEIVDGQTAEIDTMESLLGS